jgi:lipopolysaccharide export system ATP-binding protein
MGGQVLLTGKDVTFQPMYQRARLGMGYLSQETSVFRKLSVEQNILAILEAMPACRSLGRSLTRRERNERCDAILQQFGLNKVRKNNAARLSGGEKRRLEIARCLVCEPLLILLDEPFTGIDPITIADIQQIVRDLCKQGIGILLTDHRVAEVLKITDRSYLIKDGRVFTHGSPDEIVNDPIAIREYLGTSFQDTIHGGRSSNGPAANAPATPAESSLAVPQLLEQERIHRLIEQLKSDRKVAAAGELCECGRAAVPALLEALERRDVEMRTMAFATLQRILDAKAVFDPYAPEAHRKHQLAILRDEVHRKAG